MKHGFEFSSSTQGIILMCQDIVNVRQAKIRKGIQTVADQVKGGGDAYAVKVQKHCIIRTYWLPN
jgi:hypothetical protein